MKTKIKIAVLVSFIVLMVLNLIILSGEFRLVTLNSPSSELNENEVYLIKNNATYTTSNNHAIVEVNGLWQTESREVITEKEVIPIPYWQILLYSFIILFILSFIILKVCEKIYERISKVCQLNDSEMLEYNKNQVNKVLSSKFKKKNFFKE